MFAGSFLVLSATYAGQVFAVNRCTDAQGKVTFQDAPCASALSSRRVETSDAFSARPKGQASTVPRLDPPSPHQPAQETATDEYATARGSWRGPVQFQIAVGGVRDASAQRVTPMVIELTAAGEVSGVIPAMGCTLSGLTSTFVAPNMANVDVSLKSCQDTRFNTRFTGHLMSSVSTKEANLNLSALSMRVLGKPEQATLQAVLKR